MHSRLFVCAFIILNIVFLSENVIATSNFSDSIFYSGDILFDLNKSYSVGDVIKTKIHIANFEDFPIANAYLVIDVVQGCKEPFYPSQASDCDNIFYEKTIKNIDLPPKGHKEIPFSYALNNLKAGTYRVDVFLLTDKTPIVGIPYIHLPGRYRSFELIGNGSSYNLPKILRTKTHLQNETGPIGVGVDPGSMVKGEVYILSETETEAKLFVSICEWDDISCKSYDWEKIYPVSLKTGENKVDITFNAPLEPSAYAVRFELKNLEGNTLSLYRSRIIVKGKTAKIRKLAVSKPFFKEDETGKIYLLIGASPDHYTKPVVKNVKCSVKLTDLLSKKIIFESEKIIPKLSYEENLILEPITFEFTTEHELKKFEICSTLKSEGGKIYDEYCYTIDSNKFVFGKKFTLNYTYENQVLNAKICSIDNSGMYVPSEVKVILLNTEDKTTQEKGGKINDCSNFEFIDVEKGVYELIVNDIESKKQFTFTVNLSEFQSSRINSITPSSHKFIDIKLVFYLIIIIVIMGIIALLLKRS